MPPTPIYSPSHPPLPQRHGVAPSYLWLPEGAWSDLIECLSDQFPDVSKAVWLDRLARNEVRDQHGAILRADSPARRGMCIFYYREIANETVIPFSEVILYRDAHLLVVDKPHFLPVTPGGRFLHESLLVRLKRTLGIEQLSPIHRLDRETAGVMLFSLQAQTRGKYQVLFQEREVDKTYHALAPSLTLDFPISYESRIVESANFFVMQEVAGAPNSQTHIDLLENRGALSLYQLKPSTGRRHQLRVHLASLGAPIVNDSFYPKAAAWNTDDFEKPLQLLAKSIAFNDPIEKKLREFHSEKSL